MSLLDVAPSEVHIRSTISSSKLSSVFLVMIRGITCVMKVHQGRGPRRYYESENKELDAHVLEIKAYMRLKTRGLCGRVVPDFLGSMRKFDPSKFDECSRDFLKGFLFQEHRPSAIFLEYLPQVESLELQHYNPARMKNFVAGMREIHLARVLHNDARPRNMMVVKDSPDKIVWLDFNKAVTFDEDKLSPADEKLLADEEEGVRWYEVFMYEDYTEGSAVEDTGLVNYGGKYARAIHSWSAAGIGRLKL